jgi:pimeloyl-ACP methyl ester carboxylesterase
MDNGLAKGKQKMTRQVIPILLTLAAFTTANASEDNAGKYAEVNGLKMYYEVHGKGKPLVLLHGAFGTAEVWARVLPTLAKSRQVIIIEQQGHGHTQDRDAPLSYERMADDTAALLRSINVRAADVFGYSMGGVVGLRLAMKHPDLVNKLAMLGSHAGSVKATYDPVAYAQLLSLPDNFAPPVLKDPYDRVAPDKSKWPVLVKKIKGLDPDFKGFTDEEVKSIKAPTLIMQGDRDGVKPEHAVELMRLIPDSQLAIFPDGDHFILYTRSDKVVEAFMTFFDAPAKTGDR